MNTTDDTTEIDWPGGPHILVAALGNLLLMDDGVGVHVVHELAKEPVEGALAVEIGTAVLTSLHLLEWAERVLVIDAVQAGGEPGTLYYFDVDCAALPERQLSLHELSLVGALRFIAEEKKPRQIMILGIEPDTIDYGMDLTPKVAAALPRAVEAVRRIVGEWVEEGAQT
jgi:hydrogenase maturation protease